MRRRAIRRERDERDHVTELPPLDGPTSDFRGPVVKQSGPVLSHSWPVVLSNGTTEEQSTPIGEHIIDTEEFVRGRAVQHAAPRTRVRGVGGVGGVGGRGVKVRGV